MTRSSIARLMVTSVLAFSSLSIVAVDIASAQQTSSRRGGSSRSTPSGSGGGGDSTGDSPIEVFVRTQQCQTRGGCGARPIIREIQASKCDTWVYPQVRLPSGRIVTDYDAQPVRDCRLEPDAY